MGDLTKSISFPASVWGRVGLALRLSFGITALIYIWGIVGAVMVKLINGEEGWCKFVFGGPGRSCSLSEELKFSLMNHFGVFSGIFLLIPHIIILSVLALLFWLVFELFSMVSTRRKNSL